MTTADDAVAAISGHMRGIAASFAGIAEIVVDDAVEAEGLVDLTERERELMLLGAKAGMGHLLEGINLELRATVTPP